MSGHTGAVVQLKFSPDGDTIYTASTDKTVWIWEILWLSIRCHFIIRLVFGTPALARGLRG